MRTDVPLAPKPSIAPVPVRARAGTWVLELPFTTALSLNDRDMWAVKAKKVKPWRDAAHVLAMHAKIPPLKRAKITLHYVPKDSRRRDVLNLAATLKPLEDGLVDAKVVPDDTSEFIEPTLPVIHPAGPVRVSGGRFWLEIEAL